MEQINRSVYLVSRPKGMPTLENFELIKSPIPEIKEGEVLVQAIYLSVDPYMRGRMTGIKTYADPFELDEVLIGGVVGEVVQTKNSSFQVGEIVEGRLGWADYSVSDGTNIRIINPNLAPISTAVGVVGMPGLTAYFGLLDIGKPKEGETVVISGAGGAVGMTVGQIAKIKGCRVVGITGSETKKEFLEKELGFDVVVNYRMDNLPELLQEACPNGVDIYFDNVGGVISDSVMPLINFKSRIVLCGQISGYNSETQETGPRVQKRLVHRSALMQGFIVGNYADRFQEGYEQLGQWVKQGMLKYHETIVEGLENAPEAFIGLFKGENLGKQLVLVNKEKASHGM